MKAPFCVAPRIVIKLNCQPFYYLDAGSSDYLKIHAMSTPVRLQTKYGCAKSCRFYSGVPCRSRVDTLVVKSSIL